MSLTIYLTYLLILYIGHHESMTTNHYYYPLRRDYSYSFTMRINLN